MAVALKKEAFENPVQQEHRTDLPFWLSIAACCIALGCALTPASLWIDEGFSAWIAGHRSLGEAIRSLVAIGPDIQMPLHYVWLWLWAQVFGTSEYVLRAANLPFAVIFVLSLALTSRTVFGRRFAWIPLALSPFAWYYMNEARAYFMLLSFATAAVGAALAWSFGPACLRTRSAWCLCAAGLLALLTHMLAALVFPGLCVILFAGWRNGRQLRWHEWRVPVLLFALPALAVGIFYAATLLGDAPKHDYGGMTISSIAGVVYEHLGFLGLGPSKNLLRTGSADFSAYIFWLAVGVVGLTVAYAGMLRGAPKGVVRALLIALGLCLCLTILAGILLESRFLGRHLAAVLPLLLFATLAQFRWRTQVITLALVWIAADVRLRTMPEYDKDDYRTAIQKLAALNQAEPGLLAWAADTITAGYYGLHLHDPDGMSQYNLALPNMLGKVEWSIRNRGIVVINWSSDSVAELLRTSRGTGRPVYLALSKPDLYDEAHGWQQAIASEHPRRIAETNTFSILQFDGVKIEPPATGSTHQNWSRRSCRLEFPSAARPATKDPLQAGAPAHGRKTLFNFARDRLRIRRFHAGAGAALRPAIRQRHTPAA